MMTKFITILLMLIITLTTSHFYLLNAEILVQEELNSAIWLIRFYGSTVGQNQASICATGSPFTCRVIGNDTQHYHIYNIDLKLPNYTYVGDLDPLITELTFPEVYSINIDDSYDHKNYSINPLDYFKYVPKCVTLKISNDYCITQIPANFSQAFPNLSALQLYSYNLTSIPVFFNSSRLYEVKLYVSSVADLVIPPSIYMPIFSQFIIGVSLQNNSTVTFTNTSFPLLNYLNIIGMDGEGEMNVVVDTPNVVSLYTYMTSEDTGYVNPIIKYPNSIQRMIIGGPNASFQPSDLSLYKSLNDFTVSNANIQFPYSTPLPSTMSNLRLGDNITGTVPSNLLVNDPYLVDLDFESNTLLQGSLGQEYCYIQSLKIKSSNITSIPDCWWCYYNLTTNARIFSTSLTKPSNLSCEIQVNNTNIISNRGQFRIVGENLGWGYAPNLTLVYPNKILNGYLNLANGRTQNLTISFTNDTSLAQYKKTFHVIDVAFWVKNVTYNLKDINNNNGGIGNGTGTRELLINFEFVNFDAPPNVTLEGIQLEMKSYNSSLSSAIYNIPVDRVISDYSNLTLNSLFETQRIFPIFFVKDTIVTSITMSPEIYPPKYLNFYGYFGDMSQIITVDTVSLTINSTLDCILYNITSTLIQCTFADGYSPAPGPASFNVITPNGNYSSSSLLFIPYPLPNNDDCMKRTNDCNGHGRCVNGQCQCDDGWVDNCRLQTNRDPDVIFKPNQTYPTATFGYKDFIFSFNMVSIQELDVNGNISKQLDTNQWLLSNQSTNDLISLRYSLVSHQNNNTHTSSDYTFLNVTTEIEFSNSPRTIIFGGSDSTPIQLSPGSIKIGVNITNWTFSTVLSNLRVVFSTTINDYQAIVGCDDSVNEIQSFQSFLNGDSLQYLRVVKDNIQFFGRFIDYCLSDGRKTYSRVEVINTTKADPQQNQSIALIGLTLPQCQECLLDPDFSALVINPDSYGSEGTCDAKNDKWKMIVGIIFGVIGGIGLAILIFYGIKRLRIHLILTSKGKSSSTIKMDNM